VAERQRLGALRWAAFVVALIAAVVGVAFLVVSVEQHQDARDDLTRARRNLAAARAHSSADAEHLKRAQQTVHSVHDQLASMGLGVGALSSLDQRDLTAVRDAIQAGLAGNLAGYNAAVDQRAALDPQHDAAVEQLRQQVNAVIVALDRLS
jgi:hypothetical protein